MGTLCSTHSRFHLLIVLPPPSYPQPLWSSFPPAELPVLYGIFRRATNGRKLLTSHSSVMFTARIRRKREGNSFTLCVSPHLDRGRGVPPSGWKGGGYLPSQVWGVLLFQAGGYYLPRQWGGTTFPGMGYPLTRQGGTTFPDGGGGGTTFPGGEYPFPR